MRGTDSSTALVVLGVVFLLVDIVSLITHKKIVPDQQTASDDALAEGEEPYDASADHSIVTRNVLHAEAVALNSAFPRRVFILQLVALVFYFAIIFIPNQTIRNHFYPCLGVLILGIGFYLSYRGGSGRIAGILGLALLGLASALRNLLVPQADGTVSLDYFALYLILPSFLDPALVAMMGIVGARRKQTSPCFGTFLFLTAVVLLLLDFFLHWNGRLFSQTIDIIVVVTALSFLFCFALIPAAYVAKAFQEKGGKSLLFPGLRAYGAFCPLLER